jgi:hypothetical protein
MAWWSCGDNDSIQVVVLEKLFCVSVDFGAWMILGSVVTWLGCPLYDCIELQVGVIGDEWNVKDLCREAVTNNTNVPLLAGHLLRYEDGSEMFEVKCGVCCLNIWDSLRRDGVGTVNGIAFGTSKRLILWKVWN